jgi:polysaccharide biosynthesis protein PelA
MIALVDRAPAHLLIQTLLIVIVGVWLFDTTFPSNRLLAQGNTREFGVYYGTQFDPRLSEFDLLVLDPDARLDLARLRRLAPGKQIILGYLALCELGPGRGYAAKARDAGVLLHESATWPGSFYLDIRRPEWRRMVVEEIAPAILRIGFDGLFLDTIDDAAWLETTGNPRLVGMRDAAVGMLSSIRHSFPTTPLMLNRGFELLPAIERDLDMVLAESILTTTAGRERMPTWVPKESYDRRVDELRKIQARRPRLKLYSLDYWSPADSAGMRKIYSIQRSHGLLPYVSTPTLTAVVSEPAP